MARISPALGPGLRYGPFELALGDELEALVDRQDQGVTVDRGLVMPLPAGDVPAERAELGHVPAGPAAQIGVVVYLEALEALVVAAREPQQGAGQIPGRVEALRLGLDQDPRQLAGADGPGLGLGEAALEPDEGLALAEPGLYLGRVHPEDRGQDARGRTRIADLGRHRAHAVRMGAGRQDAAVPIEDLAPLGLDRDLVEALRERPLLEPGGADGLEVEETACQHPEADRQG